MLNINSSLLEQALSLLEEHGVSCTSAEAPRCASLSFSSLRDEVRAINLLDEHFGTSALLGGSVLAARADERVSSLTIAPKEQDA